MYITHRLYSFGLLSVLRSAVAAVRGWASAGMRGCAGGRAGSRGPFLSLTEPTRLLTAPR